MITKSIVLFMAYSVLLAYDMPKLIKKPKREIIPYVALMIIAVYLSVDFMSNSNLPDLNELLDLTLTEPAKWIVEHLKVEI